MTCEKCGRETDRQFCHAGCRYPDKSVLMAKLGALDGLHHIHAAAQLGISANTVARLRRELGQVTPKPRVKYYDHNGERKTVAEWSESTGLPITLINKRVGKGWTVERALTQKRQKREK